MGPVGGVAVGDTRFERADDGRCADEGRWSAPPVSGWPCALTGMTWCALGERPALDGRSAAPLEDVLSWPEMRSQNGRPPVAGAASCGVDSAELAPDGALGTDTADGSGARGGEAVGPPTRPRRAAAAVAMRWLSLLNDTPDCTMVGGGTPGRGVAPPLVICIHTTTHIRT